MKEKIKRGLKKAVLGGIILLYGFKTNQYIRKSSKYREEEKGYRGVLKEVTRDKSGVGLKSEFKKLGTQLILDYLIAFNYAKANKHIKKSLECEKKKQEYTSRLEEISKYKNGSEGVTGDKNRLENITKEDSTNLSLETSVNKGYHASMEEFYRKYEAENDTLTGTIGKILAGDYIENGKRIWYWKDRIRKIKEYMENKQGLSEQAQKQIFDILNKNNYFIREKKTEIASLKDILFNNEGIKKEITDYLQKTSYKEQETQTP